MEVGQGPNWGCNAKGKKNYCNLKFNAFIHPVFRSIIRIDEFYFKTPYVFMAWYLINTETVLPISFAILGVKMDSIRVISHV
jgi:hypothetical protein